jgi:hypothetical protein
MRLLKSETEFETSVLDRITMLEEKCKNYENEIKIMKLALSMLIVDVECLNETVDELISPIIDDED